MESSQIIWRIVQVHPKLKSNQVEITKYSKI